MPPIGSYVVVHFWDHVENALELQEARIVGILTSDGMPDYIRVRSWECVPEPDPDCQTEWCIVRAAILSVQQLIIGYDPGIEAGSTTCRNE